MNQKILNKIREFTKARNWEQFHTGENLAKSLIIEAAELLELYQWDNKTDKLQEMKEELADVMIYAIMLADKYGFDIEEIILAKIKKNEEKYPVSKAYGKSNKYNEL
ncbi:MAG TPA: nucleotide pyrophosphohydrolase [Acholeplasmataceae bacterium]|jgi:NTP pyrophosphatase (non-canonical NTP hydrolase)|nr:nucleotide pyrophosphohydrolase [Acholeplasmataceae bacterium]